MANESPFSEDENILVAALMQELPKVEEFAKLLTHTIMLFRQRDQLLKHVDILTRNIQDLRTDVARWEERLRQVKEERLSLMQG